jgi:hypothetical protein
VKDGLHRVASRRHLGQARFWKPEDARVDHGLLARCEILDVNAEHLRGIQTAANPKARLALAFRCEDQENSAIQWAACHLIRIGDREGEGRFRNIPSWVHARATGCSNEKCGSDK